MGTVLRLVNDGRVEKIDNIISGIDSFEFITLESPLGSPIKDFIPNNLNQYNRQ